MCGRLFLFLFVRALSVYFLLYSSWAFVRYRRMNGFFDFRRMEEIGF